MNGKKTLIVKDPEKLIEALQALLYDCANLLTIIQKETNQQQKGPGE